MTRSAAWGKPSKQAVVGQVRTVWPTRSRSRLARPGASKPKSSTLAPDRPSGVSSGKSSASMPASTLHPITDVAKPVIALAAVRAHAGESAVINTRAARMSNASANVFTTRTPRRSMLSPLSPVMPSPTSR